MPSNIPGMDKVPPIGYPTLLVERDKRFYAAVEAMKSIIAAASQRDSFIVWFKEEKTALESIAKHAAELADALMEELNGNK